MPSAAAIGSQISGNSLSGKILSVIRRHIGRGLHIGDGLDRKPALVDQHAIAAIEEFAVGRHLGGGLHAAMHERLERRDRNDGVIGPLGLVVAPVLDPDLDAGGRMRCRSGP